MSETEPARRMPVRNDVPAKMLSRIAMAAHLAPTSKIFMMTPDQAISCCVLRLYLVSRYSVGDCIPVAILSLAQRGAIRWAPRNVAAATAQAHQT